MPSNPPRIAVVGGGISGLTAAYRLTKLLPHAEVELFEAGERLGGVVQTRREGVGLMECGADSFITKLPAAVELCKELGLGDEIIPTNSKPRRALILHGGELLPVPAGFVQMRPERYGPMLSSRLLSWRGKLRLLAERWIPSPGSLGEEDFDESVASFATRRLGKEVFERLVQPLLAGIYTADPYRLSVAATMPTVIEAEREYGSLMKAMFAARRKTADAASDSGARYGSFVTLRNGLGDLIHALEQRLDEKSIHLQTQIHSIAREPAGHWTLTTTAASQPLDFDGIIIALPAPRASQLLMNADPKLSQSLSEIEYASSAVVGLVYQRDQIADSLNGFGIVVPTVEGRPIVAASFSSIKFPNRALAGQVLIRVFLGGALKPELMEKTDVELLELAKEELSKILGITGDPLQSHIARWIEKMPQYHVGHLQLVGRIESQVASCHGLELAGNAYRGVGIPQCVQSGNSAARRLIDSLGLDVLEPDI